MNQKVPILLDILRLVVTHVTIYPKLKSDNFNWKINHQIKAGELRVLGPDGKQMGVMKLADALKKSQEMAMDLIEIAPLASPPVAKIMELGKFRYDEEKKLKKQKRGTKTGEVKEIRFSPFIGAADYATRLGRINEFLKSGNKIRIVVKFKGRELNSKKFGYNLISKLVHEVAGEINVDMEPKFFGRHLTSVISPIKQGKKKNEETKTKDKEDHSKEVQNNQKG